jgi:CubicO group peptidase (beta-lactamase class C family)
VAIDHYISTEARLQTFSGTVLIAQNGKVLLDKAYGWADEGQRHPDMLSTRFEIGSVTKQFTAMAILLLQQRGKLHVQDPVCLFIKGCPPTWTSITIQHLLTHTSGIPDYSNALALQPRPSSVPLLDYLEQQPLDFPPGSQFRYSPSGYAVLGFVTENVAEEPYSEFLQREIFNPLHMNDTGDVQTSYSVPQLAMGYTEAWTKASPSPASPLFAAGNLYSTVGDLYRWDTALFDRTFASDSLSEMFTPHVTFCGLAGAICSSSECAAAGASCYSYGYGWYLQREAIGKSRVPLFTHGGLVPGFASLNSYYPDQHLTVIMLSNLETFASNQQEFAAEVESEMIGNAA